MNQIKISSKENKLCLLNNSCQAVLSDPGRRPERCACVARRVSGDHGRPDNKSLCKGSGSRAKSKSVGGRSKDPSTGIAARSKNTTRSKGHRYYEQILFFRLVTIVAFQDLKPRVRRLSYG